MKGETKSQRLTIVTNGNNKRFFDSGKMGRAFSLYLVKMERRFYESYNFQNTIKEYEFKVV